MKNYFWLLLALLGSTNLFAQPANDDCSGIINLGTTPICPSSSIYNNVNATDSDIGNDNIPVCFMGTPQRDVWFSFSTIAGLENLVVELTGQSDGLGNNSISNPQIAIYRGDCEFDGLVLLDCVSAANGTDAVSIELSGLTPGLSYFLRVNDWSASATPNWGAFEFCISEPPPIFTMLDGFTNECSGTLYDSGGPDNDYSDNEDLTFTICPDQPAGCILFNVQEYTIEDNFDNLFFFDGNTVNAPQIGEITGVGGNAPNIQGVCYQVKASSGCLTILMESDVFVNAPGFVATWECSNEPCPSPEPLVVNAGANPAQLANAFSSPLMDITVTNINCTEEAYGSFLATDNTDLGVEEGILLTTGNASEVANPATFFANNALNRPGNPELDIIAAQNFGQTTSDACVIELDIFAKSNKIQFDYIFGSDEYKQEFSPFSDDLIAILISGTGIVGDPLLDNQENIGVLPTNDQFVSIQNVNGGNNWEYYRDNGNSQTIAYNGLTVGFMGEQKYLTATQAVIPCNNYRVQLMIGDTDINDDSGLFVSPSKEGVPEIAVRFNNGIDYLVEGCTDIPDIIEFSLARPSEIDLSFDINVGGTATNGIDYQANIPNEITFPAGETNFSFPITTLADAIMEGTETIEISIINDFGCGAVELAAFTLNIEESLNLQIGEGQDTIFVCTNTTDNPLSVTGAANYQWSPANLFNNPNSANPTINLSNSQLITVTGTVGSCTNTESVFIQLVSPEINIELQGSNQICGGESVTLTANNNVNDAGLFWSPATGLSDANTATVTANPTVTTTYEVAVIVAEGCTARDEITIEVTPFFVPELSTTDTTICQNSSIQLATGQTAGNTLYEWSPAEGLNDANIPNPIATPDESIIYTLTASSPDGLCEEIRSVEITVLPADVDILGPDTINICLGDTASFTANTSTNGSGLIWSPVDSLSSTTTSTVFAHPTNSTWYVANLSVGTCLVKDSIFIRVDSIPNTFITAVPDKEQYCEGETISLVAPTYENLDFPDITHQWSPIVGTVSPDSLFNLVLNASESVTYTRITQNNACRDTAEIEINVVPTPEINITPTNPVICAGDDISLLAISDNIENFNWSPSLGLSCTDCADPTASPPESITYTVNGEFMGCPAFANVFVEVTDAPFIEFTDETVICEEDEIENLGLTIADPDATYLWEINGQFFSNEAQPSSGELTETTTFNVTVEKDGCPTVNQSITIMVINEPNLQVNFTDTTVCEMTSLALIANVDISGGQFTWSVNNEVISNAANITVTPEETSIYEVNYNSPTNSLGNVCFPKDETIIINVNETFLIDSLFALPNETFEGEPIELTVSFNPISNQPNNPEFTWILEGNTFDQTQTDTITTNVPEITDDNTLQESYIYEVSVLDDFGCLQTAFDTIIVINSLAKMPNVFTPNGDQSNDLFRLVQSPNVDVLDFRIYDRWGNEVYQLNDNPDGWDGQKNDKAMPADVYLYIIEYNFAGNRIVEKGDVTLIR